MTTLSPTKPTETHTLQAFFDAYGISELQVTDEPGEGTEINAFSADGSYVELPLDADEASCVDGIDWDTYCPLVLDFLYDKAGEYTEISCVITPNATGGFQLTGDVNIRISA